MITILFGSLWDTALVAAVTSLLAAIGLRRPPRSEYQDLEDRLRHPARWAARHPIRAIGRLFR